MRKIQKGAERRCRSAPFPRLCLTIRRKNNTITVQNSILKLRENINMAKDKKVEQITNLEDDFAQWYTDICRKAELVEYASVKGFTILRPYGFAIWENMQRLMDAEFKKTGHENVAMPVLIPESLLKKEGELVNGFAPDTSRSKYNFHIVKPESRYYHFIQSRIEQAGCRTRKDSTRFVDTLITASPEFFKKKSPKEIQAFFQRAADFLIGRVGKENIVSAVVHMDEKTPHLHLVFVPLTEDNRLCAKEIIGNRASLTKWQDDFHAYMVEKYPDLERGESASKTGRKHIPTRLFKQAVNLSKQARAIEATLDGITPLNAGKKKEEALSLLKKWFPQMGEFLRSAQKIQGHNKRPFSRK